VSGQWVRLRQLADVNPSTPEFSRLADDDLVTFLPLEAIWPGAGLDTSRARPKADVSSGYTRFRRGDILLPKITPTFEADRTVIARDLIGDLGAGTTELHVVRTGPLSDARYLNYTLSSRPFLLEGAACMIGVAGQQRVPDAFVRDWRVLLRPLAQQQAIADYLDAEAGQIDALVGTRSSQETLVQERQLSMLSRLLVPDGVVFIPLRRLAVIQSGLIVDALRDISDDPVTRPYLRVANVQPGRLELESVTEITVPRGLAERCTLRAGDVLMTEGGDLDKLGRGTVWREELPGALHQNHIFAVRPVPGQLDPDYLGLLTQTAHARAYFESTGVRTTNLASTNSEKIMSLPIPRLDLDEQRRLVREARTRLDQMAAFRESLRSQAGLLLERRQALITAAVTGQIEIPGVAA
jgi:type I restriction enzyme, S subunit